MAGRLISWRAISIKLDDEDNVFNFDSHRLRFLCDPSLYSQGKLLHLLFLKLCQDSSGISRGNFADNETDGARKETRPHHQKAYAASLLPPHVPRFTSIHAFHITRIFFW